MAIEHSLVPSKINHSCITTQNRSITRTSFKHPHYRRAQNLSTHRMKAPNNSVYKCNRALPKQWGTRVSLGKSRVAILQYPPDPVGNPHAQPDLRAQRPREDSPARSVYRAFQNSPRIAEIQCAWKKKQRGNAPRMLILTIEGLSPIPSGARELESETDALYVGAESELYDGAPAIWVERVCGWFPPIARGFLMICWRAVCVEF